MNSNGQSKQTLYSGPSKTLIPICQWAHIYFVLNILLARPNNYGSLRTAVNVFWLRHYRLCVTM
jgi:hypothetical protein